MSESAKPTKAKATLSENQISSGSTFGRRAFLFGTLGATTAVAGCVTTGITDADPVDPVGGGRGTRVSGLTDSDGGAYADPVGNGRGQRTSGLTDSDTGPRADPVGNGRGRRVCTDADLGYYADAPGFGRRC